MEDFGKAIASIFPAIMNLVMFIMLFKLIIDMIGKLK